MEKAILKKKIKMRPLTRNEKTNISFSNSIISLGAFRFVIKDYRFRNIQIEYENLIMQNNNILKREGKVRGMGSS